ncbi:MAG: sigma factor [Planctomycetaceae bacterium]|nr:sigma factor [Planctomycetaceae bacterium]
MDSLVFADFCRFRATCFTIIGMADLHDGQSDAHPNSMQFLTTHWSLVLAAGRRGTVESDSALERLCKSYWPPLYAYVRRRVPDLHEAQDLTQAFFECLLDREYLADADPERGRFQAFLLAAFKHFLSKEWRKAQAQKRGGDRRRIAFDFVSQDALEPADHLTPEKLFERQWAITLLVRVMQRLQRDMERSGKGRQFELLKHILSGDNSDVTLADVAAELGQAETATRMAASRMRSRYRELLREEISQTLSSQEDVEDEIRSLFAAFES